MWWENFFDNKYKNHLQKTYPESLTILDLALIKKFAKKKSKILDLACGYGRLFIPLREEGYKVFGLDYSSQMISGLRKKYKKFIKIGDYKDKNFPDNSFDLVFCFFSSFGYLKNNYEDFLVISRAANTLKRNGIFIIDLRNAQEIFTEKMAKRIAGKTRNYKINRYPIEEMRKMLEAAGLKIVHIYGDQKMARYNKTKSKRMIIVARK